MKTFTKPLEGPIPPIQVKWRFRQARKGWDHMGSRRRHLAKTQFCCLAPCFRSDDLSSSSLSETLFTKRIPKKHTKLSQIAKQTEHTNTRARVHMIYAVFKECKKVHTVKMFIIKYIMYPNYTVYKYIYKYVYNIFHTILYNLYNKRQRIQHCPAKRQRTQAPTSSQASKRMRPAQLLKPPLTLVRGKRRTRGGVSTCVYCVLEHTEHTVTPWPRNITNDRVSHSGHTRNLHPSIWSQSRTTVSRPSWPSCTSERRRHNWRWSEIIFKIAAQIQEHEQTLPE